MSANPEKILVATRSPIQDKLAIQDKLSDQLIKLTDSFLNDFESSQFYLTARFARRICQKRMQVGKLLSLAFKADPDSIAKIFTEGSANAELLLIKRSFNEGYTKKTLKESKEKEEFVSVRRWKSVSPLQAAALCLDNFLVKELLVYILKDKSLLVEAKKQLEEVQNRIAKNESENSASVTTQSSNQDEINLKKQILEKAQFSDSEAYAAPIKSLMKAYLEFSQLNNITREWSNLKKFWEEVGNCQTKLPRYVLQEFFQTDYHFEKEPKRGKLRLARGLVFSFDIGEGTELALYNSGAAVSKQGEYGNVRVRPNVEEMGVARLYKTRALELKNIIDHLQSFEMASEFLSTNKRWQIIHNTKTSSVCVIQ